MNVNSFPPLKVQEPPEKFHYPQPWSSDYAPSRGLVILAFDFWRCQPRANHCVSGLWERLLNTQASLDGYHVSAGYEDVSKKIVNVVAQDGGGEDESLAAIGSHAEVTR